MNTDTKSVIIENQTIKEKTMKKIALSLAVLTVAGIAGAANVPSGLTGLWLFSSSADRFSPTIGSSAIYSYEGDSGNSTWFGSPITQIGTASDPNLYTDSGAIQDRSWDYLQVTDGIAPNGGGSYVNQYTVMIDYVQTQTGPYNSLFQTASGPWDNDGDLWITGGGAGSTIGSGDLGYSTSTFDASQWHRIVWSVDNNSFFRVYVDGTLYLDSAAQGVDGRYSLNPTFYLSADNNWEDLWGEFGTVAVWDHALTSSEVSAMGGWTGGSTPTALVIVPEPATLSFMAFGVLALAMLRKNRK